LKDLIDDAPIEESDGEDSDASRQSKKRKSDDDDFDDRLEDEDYDLIEENLGVKVERVSHIYKIYFYFFCYGIVSCHHVVIFCFLQKKLHS
jgi:hypothetical protein